MTGGEKTNNPNEDDGTGKGTSSTRQTTVSTRPYLGSIEPFNEEVTSWDSYIERLEQFFEINEVANDKKRHFLLMFIGQKCYDVLRDMCQPEKPASKTYDQLVTLMKNHLNPKPSVLSERYKFHKITQSPKQNISDFVLSLKRAATDCDFENRDISLRDQFVSGLLSDNLKKRLFTESSLTFKSAVEIALSWETAEHDVAVVHVPDSTGMNYTKYGKSQRGGICKQGRAPSQGPGGFGRGRGPTTGNGLGPSRGRGPGQHQNFGRQNNYKPNSQMSNSNSNTRCSCCGRNNHVRSKCRYIDYSCRVCNQKGHLAAVCNKKGRQASYRQNNIIDEHNQGLDCNEFDELSSSEVNDLALPNNNDVPNDNSGCSSFDTGLYHCQNEMQGLTVNHVGKFSPRPIPLVRQEPPIMINVEVDSKILNMEVDTGSPISAISVNLCKELFPYAKMQKSELNLKSYDGALLNPLGFITVNVVFNSRSRNLDLYVFSNGGAPLIGRNWLRELNIVSLNLNHVSNVDNVLSKIYAEFPRVFSHELGTFTKKTISLRVKPGTIPIYCKPRPVPFALQEKVNLELDNLVTQGILEPVDFSDWGTPIVCIPKDDGSVRICGDFSVTLNPNLIVERYPLPKMECLLAKLSGSAYFSKIDLKMAYCQLMLDDESKKLTTISTNKGLYVYTRIPFGITSGPSIFQKVIDQTLAGLDHVISFQDDILIFGGKSQEDHLSNVRNVLKRLDEVGFTVKKEKCEILKDSINYLGFHIDKNGTHTDPSKVEAVLNAPAPTNVSELKSFLGMVNFYGRFLSNLADVMHPMYKLLSKDVRWNWSKECNDAFESVKRLLTQAPCLAHYDSSLSLKLACDASSYGLGCVLSCVFPDGSERPIAYASRVLSKAESGYSQIQKESLAIVFGVKKFYQYLYSRHFTLLTDHQPLLAIFGKKSGIPQMATNRLQRWAHFLSAFDFDIVYVKSAKHCNADFLSRLPIKCVVDDEKVDDFNYFKFIQTTCFPISAKNVSKETARDPVLSKVLDYVLHGWPNDANMSSELKLYFLKRTELSVEDNCVLWGYRVVIPNSLRSSLLNELHCTHLGIVKMKSIARSTFWWPKIDLDIEEVANSCEFCLDERKSPPKAIPCNWNIPHGPWERIHMDFFGPINNQMYLLVIDAYSKFIEIVPMRTITAVAVIYQLRQIFARYGLPHSAVTDNGPTWTSHEFATFMKQNGVNHCLTAPFHPATNGAAERAVQTVKKGIKIALKQGQDVNVAILRFLFDYRNATHCSTCKSPAELMFGRKLRSRFDLLRPDRQTQTNSSCKSKELTSSKTVSFSENQLVLVKDYRTSQSSNWAKATVVRILSPVSYLVRLCNSDVLWKRHCNQMLPIKESLSQPRLPSKTLSNVDRPTAVSLHDTNLENRPILRQGNPSSPHQSVDKRRSLLLSPPTNPTSTPESPERPNIPDTRPNLTVTSPRNDPSAVSPPRQGFSPASTPQRRYPLRNRIPKKPFDL